MRQLVRRDVVTHPAGDILVILSPHAHTDALHLLQPDSVLKRPIARTSDLDRARGGTSSLLRTREPSILARCPSRWRTVCCRKRGHGPRHWLPTAAPTCKRSAARYLHPAWPMFRSSAHLYPPVKLTTRSVALRAARSRFSLLGTEVLARISSILACSAALRRQTSLRSV